MSSSNDSAPKGSPPPPEEAPKPRLARPYQDDVTMIGIGIPQPAALDWEDDEGQTRVRPPEEPLDDSEERLDEPPTLGRKTLLFGKAVPVPGFAVPGFGAVAATGPEADSVAPPPPVEDLRATTRMDRTGLDRPRMDRGPLSGSTEVVAPAPQPKPSSPPGGFDPRARVTATALERVLPPSAVATPLASTTPIARTIRPIAEPEARSQSGRWMAVAAAAVAICVTAGLFFALPRLGAEPAARVPSPEQTPATSAAEEEPKAEAIDAEEGTATEAETSSPGRLVIESVPRGARVLLVDTARPDEPTLLKGPFPLTLEVPRVGFKLIATRAGHFDFIEPIAFAAGSDEAVMRVELYRRPASAKAGPSDVDVPDVAATEDEAPSAPVDDAPAGDADSTSEAEPAANEIDVTKNPYAAPKGDDGEPAPPATDSITLQD